MTKVIVTGPESSGKTTLCKQLSEQFKIPFTEEFSRKYIDDLDRKYLQEDLVIIAKEQLENEQLTRSNKQLSLHDTDLITLKIWSEYKYGNCNDCILSQIEQQKQEKRFYFLCSPDIPWQEDPQRENPHNREELFEIYKVELEQLGHNYFILEGQKRLENSIKKITELIS
jgi:nicotinamide riboside kinase